MKDQIIKFLAYDGRIAVACASTTNLVEEARKLHDLSPLATAAMGRVLTITALIGGPFFAYIYFIANIIIICRFRIIIFI